MNELPRRTARELVLKWLYAEEVSGLSAEQVRQDIAREEELDQSNLAFAKELFALVLRNREWADSKIAELAVNWDIERIAKLDRNIMRIAMTELRYLPDIPIKVAINEAIELAKKFSTTWSSSFINGILDSFARTLDGRDDIAEKPGTAGNRTS